MSRREFRSFYCDILDSDEFQALSADAKVVLFTLKLKLGKYGIRRLRERSLAFDCGELNNGLAPALTELSDGGWLQTDGKVWWLIDGLKNEPKTAMNWAIESHVNALCEYVESLPDCEIRTNFAKKYSSRIPSRFSSSLATTVLFSLVSSNNSSSLKEKKSPKKLGFEESEIFPLYSEIMVKQKRPSCPRS